MTTRTVFTLITLILTGFAAACRPSTVSATLVPEVPTQVFVEEQVQVYNFYALESATTLRLRSNPAALPYVAEVRGADGTLAATLSGGGALEDARVTLPANSGAYEVRVRTNGDVDGTVELMVSGQDDTTPTPAQQTALAADSTQSAPTHAGACQLVASDSVAVYTEPTSTSQPLGALKSGSSINAEGRAGDTQGVVWYRVRAGEVVGWIAGDVVGTSNACDTLPMVSSVGGVGGPVNVANTAPEARVAPFDADTYIVTVDPSSGGEFVEQLSAPTGDRVDRLWLSADGIPNGRTFSIRLACEGDAANALRWGTLENPALGCGSTLQTTFSPAITRRGLLISLPEAGVSGWAAYRLEVTPTAPADAEVMLFSLYRDSGGRVAEAVSAPNGDTSDNYVLRVEDFDGRAANHHRDFRVSMLCDGANTDALRWGNPARLTLGCGDAIIMSFDVATPQAQLTVALPDGAARGYLAYQLNAVPLAPADRDTYTLTLDRNAGGQFGEVISAPDGDPTDIIQITVSNLTQSPPDNYREFRLTLVCEGAGVEHVRWGLADNTTLGCGGVMSLPMLAGAESATVVVTVPAGGAYVGYTFIAQPILATPIG